jgi:hypothetical protein
MSVRAVAISVIVLLLAVGGCTSDAPPEGKPAAKVNGFVITVDMFRQRMADSAYYSDLGALSFSGRQKLINREVQKELLIQEATRRDLHKREKFRRAMEKYWAQTLITDLIEQEMANLKDPDLVTEEEVKARYDQMAAKGSVAPYEQLKERLIKELTEEKKRKALEKWVDNLRSKADVTIYEDNIKNMR